jgi:geranylgeranyl diphosphate synthase type I
MPLSQAQATGRTAKILAEARALTEPAHRAVVDDLPADIRHVAGYHSGWWEADGRVCSTPGKAIRPALALASARAAGGTARDAVAAGVAVELVHDLSLLHDDVMDGDLTRRHRPTAWAVFGVGQAILVGDMLLTLACEQACALPGGISAMKVLTGAMLEVCSGQWSDIAFEDRAEVSLAECVRMAEGKTGALLGAACELGAIAGGADRGQAARYRQFGRHLGVAFQLIDDLLGIWGDPNITGKPAGADLVARKMSLPVVAALSSGTSSAQNLAWAYRRQEPMDGQCVAHVADLIEAAGGQTWAEEEASRQLEEAFACLTAADPDPAAAADLRLLADLITHRNH